MAEKFIEWLFEDCIPDLCGTIANAIIKVYKTIIIVLLSPAWILPFTYWYFFIRDDGNMKERCETCKYHKHEDISDGYICVNLNSDNCADWTEHESCCDEWEGVNEHDGK